MSLNAIPGVGSTSTAAGREIIWGATDNRAFIVRKSRIISSTCADAGNTPTTNLRSGLLLGNVTSSSEADVWDPLATNGTKDVTEVLETPLELRTTDLEGTARDSYYKTLVRAPLRASMLLIKGVALVGHAYEYLARAQLHMAGFVLDDDPMGYLSGLVGRTEWDTTTALTPTAAQNGTTFYLSNAAAVAVTLPTIKAGLRYTFIRTADEEMTVTGTGALLVGNSSTAGTITFTTAGQQIGAQVSVHAKYIASAGTLKWETLLPYPPFGTGLATMAFAIT